MNTKIRTPFQKISAYATERIWTQLLRFERKNPKFIFGYVEFEMSVLLIRFKFGKSNRKVPNARGLNNINT